MKKKILQLGMILMICGLVITACQAKSGSTGDVLVETDAYPLPDIIIPPSDEGYPIEEDDLVLLLRTWSLIGRAEDNQSVDHGTRALQFFSNGTYQLFDGEEMTTGAWTVKMEADSTSTLTLDKSMNYDIIALNEAFLQLRSTQNGVVIDEQYVATD